MFSLGTYNNFKLAQKNKILWLYKKQYNDLLFMEKFHIQSMNMIMNLCNGLVYAFYPITLYYLAVRLEIKMNNIKIDDENKYYFNEYYAKYEK